MAGPKKRIGDFSPMDGDRPEAFAASCLELIQNMGRRQIIARLGRRLIEEQYSDRTIAAAVNDAI
jgi:hypothetical protein